MVCGLRGARVVWRRMMVPVDVYLARRGEDIGRPALFVVPSVCVCACGGEINVLGGDDLCLARAL
jgi:hypothetical protein